MTRCCQQHPMPWNGVTGAIARCKKVSTACGRKRRSVHVLHWICGVKLKPKAVNKLLHYFIVLERDKPGSSATVSNRIGDCQLTIECLDRYKPREIERTGYGLRRVNVTSLALPLGSFA